MGRRRHARRHLVVAALVLLALVAPHAPRDPGVDEATRLAPAAASPPRAVPGSSRFSLYDGVLPDGTGTYLRWDPCSTITYRVNLTAVPVRLRAQVLGETRAAVEEVAATTGLRLTYRGLTAEVPLTEPADPLEQSADLVVAWVEPEQTSADLDGGVAAQAGARGLLTSRTRDGMVYDPADPGRLGHVIVRGYVVLDAPQLLVEGKPAAGPGTSRRNTLLHELGHAVGLGHTEDPTQLMHPRLHAGTPDGFAEGDLEGLAAVGATHGCLQAPVGLPDLL